MTMIINDCHKLTIDQRSALHLLYEADGTEVTYHDLNHFLYTGPAENIKSKRLTVLIKELQAFLDKLTRRSINIDTEDHGWSVSADNCEKLALFIIRDPSRLSKRNARTK